MELEGRTAVITGASRGLGAGLARELSARGLRVALCARGACAGLPEGALAVRVDVGDGPAMLAFARQAADHLGRIDLWINNAGVVGPVVPLRDLDPAALLEHLRTNVLGVVHGSQAFVGHVRARGHEGVLVNVSSGAARRGYAGWAAYCAGKAAVERLSEVTQLEEAGRLRVYAVSPGVIDTGMQAELRAMDPEAFPLGEVLRDVHRRAAFNSIAHVATHLLRLAFDPAARPAEVVVAIPPEVSAG